MTRAVVSAADARYGPWLLNLIGSIQRKSNLFDRIVAYDLGLTPFQRRLVAGARGVELHSVPPFVPHWRAAFTWKPWIWTHVDADSVVWLDAGLTVLRPLTAFVEQIDERGYFVVSQGVKNRECIPSDYYDLYGLSEDIGDTDVVAGGILGFSKDSPFYRDVVVPTYEDVVAGRNLGYSPGDAERLGAHDGPGAAIVQDARLFRWDQTILNIHLYRSNPSLYVNDLDQFAGFRSPHDHPKQAIWGHRRRGDYRFLPRVMYQPAAALVGLPWGAYVYLRGRARHYRWLLRPRLYVAAVRRRVTWRRLQRSRR